MVCSTISLKKMVFDSQLTFLRRNANQACHSSCWFPTQRAHTPINPNCLWATLRASTRLTFLLACPIRNNTRGEMSTLVETHTPAVHIDACRHKLQVQWSIACCCPLPGSLNHDCASTEITKQHVPTLLLPFFALLDNDIGIKIN